MLASALTKIKLTLPYLFFCVMSSVIPLLVIDGSTLEGGGQLLRNSVALSALLCKPITIQKIRDGRRPPGLKAQHEAGEPFQKQRM